MDLLAEVVCQWRGLARREHRPWRLPRKPWVHGQSWRRLLFVHYRADVAAVAKLVPAPLSVETFDGSAWIGLTAFRLSGLRPEGLPPLPWLSTFPELNVRTYVTNGVRPGIWFFSLDAGSLPAVRAARAIYHLPYHHARMSVDTHGKAVIFRSERSGAGEPARFASIYGPAGPSFEPADGTLEAFLFERYCLYAHDGRALHRAEIHHRPWRIEPAEADLVHEGLLPVAVADIESPLLHYAAEEHVLVWWPEKAHDRGVGSEDPDEQEDEQ